MKQYPKAWLITFVAAAALLGVSAWVSPVWYDDAGHYLVARQFATEGSLCYPMEEGVESRCEPLSQFITMGPALSAPAGGWLAIFGTSFWGLRILIVCFSLGLLLILRRTSYLLFEQFKEEKAIATTLIVIFNIQFLTYGAEFLGEVPAMYWIFTGVYFFILGLNSEKHRMPLLAGMLVSWWMAILTKEYLLLPLGISLLLWLLVQSVKGNRKDALQAGFLLVLLPLPDLLWHLINCGSWEAFTNYLEERSAYGNEFLSLQLSESLRFLLLKPQIVLGIIALAAKIYLRRDAKDLFLGCVQFSILLFFMLSAGFDRFGVLLLPISAWYLAEFVVLIWAKFVQAQKRNILIKLFAVAALFVLVSQKTVWVMINRISGKESNENEMRIAEWLREIKVTELFTYDQQIAPFLDKEMSLRLNETVPSARESCVLMHLGEGEYFVAGPYAFTEFSHCIPWETLQLWAATPDSTYKIYTQLPEIP